MKLEIGQKLTSHRERHGYTLTELCRQLKDLGTPIDYLKLWRIETGTRYPTVTELIALKGSMPSINMDILLTGGDPLVMEVLKITEMMSTEKIRAITAGLKAARENM